MEPTGESRPLKRRKEDRNLTAAYFRRITRKAIKLAATPSEACARDITMKNKKKNTLAQSLETKMENSSTEIKTGLSSETTSIETYAKPTSEFLAASISLCDAKMTLDIDPPTLLPTITYNSNVPQTSASTEAVICDTEASQPDLKRNLRQWAIEGHVTHRVVDNLLEVLSTVKSIQELKDLPSDCRTLLKTKRTNHIISTATGRYYHFGLSLGIESALKCQVIPNDVKIINIDINIDGLPLTKSSGSQFWPILGRLTLGGAPFIIGVWHGVKKPKHCNELLEKFIHEYLSLKRDDGFLHNNKKYELNISKIICDAPAKSFILCVKGHNSYYGCTKCTTEGTYVKNRMSFIDLNSPLRTDEDFRSGKYEDYHTDITPLLQLDIDIIRNVPLDYMHLVCLGVMKRLLHFWVRGNMSIRMNAEDLGTVNLMILDIRNNLSSNEFARLPRAVDDLERWKATEFRQLLLYTGPLLFKDTLKSSQYMHFLALSCAIRILCSPILCLKYNSYAKELLEYFVRNYPKIYGEEFVSHNVHNVTHLADDVLNHGDLDKFSAFEFENYMFEIKKQIKSCNKPLEQLINRVNEKRSYGVYKKATISKDSIVVSKYDTIYNEKLLNGNLVKSYRCVTVKNFKMGVAHKNNHCLIENHVVVKIKKIVQCQITQAVFLIFNRYLTYDDSFVQPCKSTLFYGGHVNNLSNVDEIISAEKMVTKCIHYQNNIITFIV